jgi:pimeloyl-ACP methyl ester carboxylesterase
MQQVRDNFIAAELTSDQFMMPLPDAEIRRIRAPTLLVTGETSPPLWHRLAERLADLIPDSKLVDIPASSHIMHEDNAPAYNRAALAFLQS